MSLVQSTETAVEWQESVTAGEIASFVLLAAMVIVGCIVPTGWYVSYLRSKNASIE